MTPQEALQLLDNVAAAVSVSRQDHARLQQAVTVLAEAIKPKLEEKK